jgi:excisionase family DNA binding protein
MERHDPYSELFHVTLIDGGIRWIALVHEFASHLKDPGRPLVDILLDGLWKARGIFSESGTIVNLVGIKGPYHALPRSVADFLAYNIRGRLEERQREREEHERRVEREKKGDASREAYRQLVADVKARRQRQLDEERESEERQREREEHERAEREAAEAASRTSDDPESNEGLPDVLLLTEVAAICRTSVSNVRYWINSKKLVAIKPGRRVLVKRADLERFLQGGSKPAPKKPAPEKPAPEKPAPETLVTRCNFSDATCDIRVSLGRSKWRAYVARSKGDLDVEGRWYVGIHQDDKLRANARWSSDQKRLVEFEMMNYKRNPFFNRVVQAINATLLRIEKKDADRKRDHGKKKRSNATTRQDISGADHFYLQTVLENGERWRAYVDRTMSDPLGRWQVVIQQDGAPRAKARWSSRSARLVNVYPRDVLDNVGYRLAAQRFNNELAHIEAMEHVDKGRTLQ